jgi:hypothetical protein
MGLKTKGQAIDDSTQRPLQGAFLIPPVLPVVLIYIYKQILLMDRRHDRPARGGRGRPYP